MADDFASRSVIAAIFFASVLFLLFFPPFLVTLWERRLVWPYIPADEYDGRLPPLTEPAGAANDALAARGFARLDTRYDGNTGTGHRVRYDFWRPADGVVLADWDPADRCRRNWPIHCQSSARPIRSVASQSRLASPAAMARSSYCQPDVVTSLGSGSRGADRVWLSSSELNNWSIGSALSRTSLRVVSRLGFVP